MSNACRVVKARSSRHRSRVCLMSRGQGALGVMPVTAPQLEIVTRAQI